MPNPLHRFLTERRRWLVLLDLCYRSFTSIHHLPFCKHLSNKNNNVNWMEIGQSIMDEGLRQASPLFLAVWAGGACARDPCSQPPPPPTPLLGFGCAECGDISKVREHKSRSTNHLHRSVRNLCSGFCVLWAVWASLGPATSHIQVPRLSLCTIVFMRV